jgi:hypothetical protein
MAIHACARKKAMLLCQDGNPNFVGLYLVDSEESMYAAGGLEVRVYGTVLC